MHFVVFWRLSQRLRRARDKMRRVSQVPRARPLTSLPMQRCCPTPFSHLWWRLILQALQRRPCFAVLPARNTTCLAVVPDTTQTLAFPQSEHSRSRDDIFFSLLLAGGGRRLSSVWRFSPGDIVTLGTFCKDNELQQPPNFKPFQTGGTSSLHNMSSSWFGK